MTQKNEEDLSCEELLQKVEDFTTMARDAANGENGFDPARLRHIALDYFERAVELL